MGGDVEGLRVGMLGCGAVGTGVARLRVEHGRPVRDRAGVPIALQRVAVRDVTRKRDPAVDPTMVSGDA
ncbi:MAG: homoserine dehydrogenase, partial [Actinomycetes bacterium]